MSKMTWGKIGNWAAESEREEAEEREAAAAEAAAAAYGGASPQSFPSLREAASTKPKKKKQQPLTLSEFNTGTYVGPGGGAYRRDSSAFEPKGLTPEEMRRLPTGPKERSEEEMQSGRLGGGFSYGRSSGFRGDSESSWGGNRRSYGGFDDDRRGAPPSRVSDFDQPSRADEVDNWALGKKSIPTDSNRHNRYDSIGGGGGGGGFSRADEVDNWAVGKKPIVRPSTFAGSSFRDSPPGDDRWSRGRVNDGGPRERPRLVLDPPRGEVVNEPPVRSNRANPFGDAKPREEVLAEKGLDWKQVDSDIEAKKMSGLTSAQSSRPSSPQSTRSEGPPRPKVNPFGDAKPREVLLEEKGKDWRKIDMDLDHRSIDRLETEAERILKEEITQLKKELENENAIDANQESLPGSGGDQIKTRDLIVQKENELEQLTCDLDDKVRFGQKAVERPGSGAGRAASFHERQSRPYEESRSSEFMERPQSRGAGEMWIRPGDEGRGFTSGRERGFLGNREIDRSRSRGRW